MDDEVGQWKLQAKNLESGEVVEDQAEFLVMLGRAE
jgi:hypothetical protein